MRRTSTAPASSHPSSPLPLLLPRQVLVALATCATLCAARPARAQGVLEARPPESDDPRHALRLDRESLHVTIDQQFATTLLEQTFSSASEVRLEGRYLLRAGESATVTGFAYWNGEKKIVGEVFEKQAARAVYEEVAGLRRDPGLLEQEGEGSFSFRVFPIEPGEHKRVQVRFGQHLPRSGRTVEYRLPLPQGDHQIVFEIDDARGAGHPRSPTHRLDVERLGAGKLRVRAHRLESAAPAPELRLLYDVEEKPWTASTVIHRSAGQDAYVAVRMALPATVDSDQVRSKDVTLVIDHSGSMQGQPLAQALRASEAVVGRLRASDRFNVIAFDHGIDALWSTPRLADQRARQDALAFIHGIRAGGGTDIALALRTALAAQARGGAPHVVLFLTDGQSSSEEALKVARADRGDARVYTVGLGSGVQKPLLARLAADKRGRFSYIESADAITDRVTRLFQQIESPVLTDLKLESSGVTLTRLYPRTLPDLVPGDEIVLLGRALSTGALDVSLTGNLGGKPIAFTTSASVPEKSAQPHTWVGRLWARARIDDLLEEIALSGERDELKNEVIELALAYEMVTPYTSFLAIPESELTAAARGSIASAREERARVMAAHRDAAALSRDDMPPGDPVLSVKAPRDARQVTAYFPFGLVKDLRWDDTADCWQVRFLVPRWVTDGRYEVKVLIVRHDGLIELATAPYTIDSRAPDFEVEALPAAGGVLVRVRAVESVREVIVARVDDPRARLRLAPATGDVFEGLFPLAPGRHALRIVVADGARNEADHTITVEVQ